MTYFSALIHLTQVYSGNNLSSITFGQHIKGKGFGDIFNFSGLFPAVTNGTIS